MSELFLGVDIGTSGARAMAIDTDGTVQAEGKSAMSDHGENLRAPGVWWAAAETAIRQALSGVDRSHVRSIAVDGTSGTVLPVANDLQPLADGLMYNDPCRDSAILSEIAQAAPAGSPALGASSALARFMHFASGGAEYCLHQADWISARFSGQFTSDANNALKTGYDAEAGDWPEWVTSLGGPHLPKVVPAGTPIGPILPEAASAFGLSSDVMIVAGTTDGCASFVATGASKPGEGVTALGTTMTIKVLSERPIFAPEYGIYSHLILGNWLAGGASNTGGKVLLEYFDPDTLTRLSTGIDPETTSGLDYYPLTSPGERFPINDPNLPPRLEPRPDDDAAFLHGLLDGIAGVEAMAYERLQELGASRLVSIRTVGGGAGNDIWTRIREKRLGVPMAKAMSTEAAYGTALLARHGAA